MCMEAGTVCPGSARETVGRIAVCAVIINGVSESQQLPRHQIRAVHSPETITVYQAYGPEIGRAHV